jgi:hypothetical protein
MYFVESTVVWSVTPRGNDSTTHLFPFLACCAILKVHSVRFSVTSVHLYQTALRYISEGSILVSLGCDISDLSVFFFTFSVFPKGSYGLLKSRVFREIDWQGAVWAACKCFFFFFFFFYYTRLVLKKKCMAVYK